MFARAFEAYVESDLQD
ncbi:hypothetical protein [Bacillus cereus]